MAICMFRTDIPVWVKENMQMTCNYCGSFILDNSESGATTARWCANPKCPGHMAHKIKAVTDFFNIKGIGPETALGIIRKNDFKSHFDIIPHLFKEKKPMVTLADVAVLACIEGYGATTATKELSHYGTFEDYFSKAVPINPLLWQNRDLLLEAQHLFYVKPPLASKKMYVMGTGAFHGYNNREEFFRLINDAYGMYICVVQTGKRKTGVSYLIKEHDAVDHTKSAIARECGIPIVTPAEFISIIASMCPYIPTE